MKTAAAWVKTSTHPLEYQATLEGATLIVRTTRGEGVTKFEAAVYRDTQPVSRSVQPCYFSAVRWAELEAIQ